MNAKIVFLFRAAGLAAGALVAPFLMPAAEADALPAPEENFVKVSGQASSLSGNKGASQAHSQIARSGVGGIEELNVTRELSKVTTLQLDARALPGAEDYLAQFRMTKTDVGSFEAGYKRFRTFYDGAGGFFPLNNAWLPIYPRALYVDRGKFYINGTVALPNAPVFTFSYTNSTRSGRKDSTIWGDTDLTGVPIYSLAALNPISANRKIIPAYLQLGERQEAAELAVKQSFGATTVRLAVISSRINNLNTRSVDRYPGELKPFPAIPANPVTLVPAWLGNNPNKGFDQQGVKEDALTWTGRVETVFTPKMKGYVTGSYHHATIDTTGSRLITATLQTATGPQSLVGGFTPAGRSPYSQNGTGNLKQDILTGVVGFEAKPLKDFEFNAALKGEDFKTTGNYTANYVTNMVVLATGVVTPVPLAALNSSKVTEKPWIPEMSVRYTGIQNVALWALWDYRTAPGDERTSYVGLTTSTGAMILAAPTGASDKVKEKHTNLKIGANWTPNSMVMLRGELFTKDHENNFTGYGPALGGFYILDYDTYGMRVTATVRPLAVLSCSTRYLIQRGKAQISSDRYVQGNSNDSRRYQVSETIDWNPNKQVYVQANASIYWDSVGTSYPRAGGAANDVLHNADNNFWNGSVITGFVVDKETDAQVQATYYKANNYNPTLATTTTPYGASGSDYSITVGLKHKFTAKMVGSAKVGYLESKNETLGGNADYRGPVAYLALEHQF